MRSANRAPHAAAASTQPARAIACPIARRSLHELGARLLLLAFDEEHCRVANVVGGRVWHTPTRSPSCKVERSFACPLRAAYGLQVEEKSAENQGIVRIPSRFTVDQTVR